MMMLETLEVEIMSRELNTNIKNEIKSATGCKARDISVRTSSSSIRVEIKSPFINIKDVEEVVNKYESISRDEYTGEILCGGNTFVFVSYSDDVFSEVAEDFEEEAEAIIEEVSKMDIDEGKFIREHICLMNDSRRDFVLTDTRDYKRALIYRKNAVKQLAELLFKVENFGFIC